MITLLIPPTPKKQQISQCFGEAIHSKCVGRESKDVSQTSWSYKPGMEPKSAKLLKDACIILQMDNILAILADLDQ